MCMFEDETHPALGGVFIFDPYHSSPRWTYVRAKAPTRYHTQMEKCTLTLEILISIHVKITQMNFNRIHRKD